MRWTDVKEIAEALEENHPYEEINNIKLSRLQRWVVQLLDFDDDPADSNDYILESIYENWLKLREENS
jgi:FeS assembly protein IscX